MSQVSVALVLHECPYCHKFMAAEEIGKQEVDSAELTSAMQSPMAMSGDLRMVRAGGGSLFVYDPGDLHRVAARPEAFITYKLTFKCKHCNKEWTKLHVENVPIPMQYAENEGEDERAAWDKEADQEASEEN